MIKHLLTLIWNQRNGNVWIFLELLLVTAMLWVMADSLLVDTYTYRQPIGVDTQHTYLLSYGLTDDATELGIEQNTQATQDLLQLLRNLRQCPEVEAVSLSNIAVPYTYSRGWSGLMPVEDTASASYAYRVRYVDLEYFRVFKVKDKEGRPLYDQVLKNPGEIVLSETLDEIFFPEGSGRTQREVKWGPKSTESMKVSAVSAPLKEMDFDTYQPTYYYVWRTEQDFLDEVAENDIRFYDCLFRMKKDYSQQEMETFLQQESERLQVGNVYVSSVKPISEYRADMLKPRLDNQKKKIAMVGFMLVNIFFGIVGTFWLRTQSRRAEIGLRAALGASKRQLRRELFLEGRLFLLALTLPFLLIFLVNMLYLDMPDTYRLAYTWWRFLITLSVSYLLMGGMIYLGIRIPANKITRMNPAETLHYE